MTEKRETITENLQFKIKIVSLSWRRIKIIHYIRRRYWDRPSVFIKLGGWPFMEWTSLANRIQISWVSISILWFVVHILKNILYVQNRNHIYITVMSGVEGVEGWEDPYTCIEGYKQVMRRKYSLPEIWWVAGWKSHEQNVKHLSVLVQGARYNITDPRGVSFRWNIHLYRKFLLHVRWTIK